MCLMTKYYGSAMSASKRRIPALYEMSLLLLLRMEIYLQQSPLKGNTIQDENRLITAYSINILNNLSQQHKGKSRRGQSLTTPDTAFSLSRTEQTTKRVFDRIEHLLFIDVCDIAFLDIMFRRRTTTLTQQR